MTIPTQAKPLNESVAAKQVTHLPCQGCLAQLESRNRARLPARDRAGRVKLRTVQGQLIPSRKSGRDLPVLHHPPLHPRTLPPSPLHPIPLPHPPFTYFCFRLSHPPLLHRFLTPPPGFPPSPAPSSAVSSRLLRRVSRAGFRVGPRDGAFGLRWRSQLDGDCLKEICPHPSPCDQPQLQVSLS